jgi:hypothetical protein
MNQDSSFAGAVTDSDVSPTAPWVLGMRRRGAFIQAGFAGVSFVLGSLAIGSRMGDVLVVAFGAAVLGVFAYAIRTTTGTSGRPIRRPMSAEAERIERAVTRATVLTCVASSALVASSIATGHAHWALASVAIVNGALLLWLDRRFDIPRNRPVGLALIVGPVVLVATMSGSSLVAATGIASGTLLLVLAVAGFHELAGGRHRAAQTSPAGPRSPRTLDPAIFPSP